MGRKGYIAVEAHSEPSQISKMKLGSPTYFCKKLNRRCLKDFWMHISGINKLSQFHEINSWSESIWLKYKLHAGVNFFFQSFDFFFLSGFSFTDTGDSLDSRGKERTIFVPLYHFHLLTRIHSFICNFACDMTTRYF